jgi:2-polyprenyl-6-methoxyphenol hydroxylase-like FAD-dependent oxidoreductase
VTVTGPTSSDAPHGPCRDDEVDVLVVGAGPTGLALAAQLAAFGASCRIVDRGADRVHESRALAVQPRTLEVLAGLGVADTMVERGNPNVRLALHAGGRTVTMPMFDLGLEDTAYPFLLFLSQAETEAILDDHLARHGVTVERGHELVDLQERPGCVVCTLADRGDRETVTARWVVGCDGARSTVRALAGIDFTGAAYPQTFLLADLDATGLDPGCAHAYVARHGLMFFFPLVHPAPWRLLAMEPSGGDAGRAGDPPGIELLQRLVDDATNGKVRLHRPEWQTRFRIHHRHATRYRTGRVFLAGDAAHVHSPAGAQGMNTGIQDAGNLGWKLALVARGDARAALLDTYEPERQPIGRAVVRFTDRAFTIATSTRWPVPLLRTRLAPRVLAAVARVDLGRARAFRALAELDINYRSSPAVTEGRPRPRRGPRAGDRLPDGPIRIDDNRTTLHRALAAPAYHLLLIGPPGTWATAVAPDHPCLRTHRLTRRPRPGALLDPTGDVHHRLGVTGPDQTAHYLIRPDGHIAHRAAGTELSGVVTHLRHWLPTPP